MTFPKDVSLVPGKGAKGTGGGLGGHYWHIYEHNKRVGKVFINVIEDTVLGRHSSLQIFLNKNAQGRGIGRIAYKRACETSGLDMVYIHMRKSNTASRRAAAAAGFMDLDIAGIAQHAMVWKPSRRKLVK